MEESNGLGPNDLIFAYCLSIGMAVPPMGEWDVTEPSPEMKKAYKSKKS